MVATVVATVGAVRAEAAPVRKARATAAASVMMIRTRWGTAAVGTRSTRSICYGRRVVVVSSGEGERAGWRGRAARRELAAERRVCVDREAWEIGGPGEADDDEVCVAG